MKGKNCTILYVRSTVELFENAFRCERKVNSLSMTGYISAKNWQRFLTIDNKFGFEFFQEFHIFIFLLMFLAQQDMDFLLVVMSVRTAEIQEEQQRG